MINPAILTLPFFLFVGWMCTRQPTRMVHFLTSHLSLPGDTGKRTKSQEIAAYVRRNPDTWQQEYPELSQLIHLIGTVAYIMFVLGLAIVFLIWLVPISSN